MIEVGARSCLRPALRFHVHFPACSRLTLVGMGTNLDINRMTSKRLEMIVDEAGCTDFAWRADLRPTHEGARMNRQQRRAKLKEINEGAGRPVPRPLLRPSEADLNEAPDVEDDLVFQGGSPGFGRTSPSSMKSSPSPMRCAGGLRRFTIAGITTGMS